jgi:hypothetical protein
LLVPFLGRQWTNFPMDSTQEVHTRRHNN